MYNISVVVEKNDEEGFMKKDSIRLVEVGGQIGHTLTPRPGDINVQHCNLVIEFKELKTMSYTEVNYEHGIKIRQADKQGYALCEIGGGSGSKLCNKPDKARKSNRERKDLPNLDNGEYP